MPDVVRVLRVIEYIGERDSVEKQLTQSRRDGTHEFGNGIRMKVATIGDFPEILTTVNGDFPCPQ